MRRAGWRWLPLAPLTLILWMLFQGTLDPEAPEFAQWDLHSYRAMAAAAPRLAVDHEVPAPFAYRLVAPWIAGVLPGSVDTGFRLLTGALLLLLSVAFPVFLARRGIPPPHAVLFTVLFLLTDELVGFCAFDPYQAGDVLALLVLLLLLDRFLSRRWIPFGAALLLAAATRETALLVLPVGFGVLLARRAPASSWRGFLLASIPALLLFGWIRLAVHPDGGVDPLPAFLEYASRQSRSPGVWGRLLVNAFAPLSLVPLVRPTATLAAFRERPWIPLLLVLALVSTFFGMNVERLLLPGAPAAYLLAALLLGPRLAGRRWAVAALLLAGLLCGLSPHLGRVRLPSEALQWALTLGATVGTAALVALPPRGKD